MTQWSDEHIIAYLDGKLDMEQGKALHRDRQHNRELDAYIRSMEIDTDELSAVRDEMLPDTPQFAFQKTDNKASKKESVAMPDRRQVAMAASVLAVFGLGFLTSRFLPADNPPPSNWVQAVAEYQMLYSGETLALLEKNPDQQGREVAEIGRKLDLILVRSDLNVEGLTFKRGQLLNYKNKPLVQFAYLDDNGTPIAFCIIRRDDRPEQGLQSKAMLAGQNAVTWSTGQYGFVVIGKADPTTIEKYAKQLKARMASI